MFTLKDYMLAEQEGQDPAEQLQQSQSQDRMVSLVTEIRQIMSRITMANQSEVAQDSNLISFIDIIEALNTTEEVIRDRLSNEGATVDKRDGGTEHVDAMGAEHENDENFDILFNSIEDQVKDTIRTIYTVTKGRGEVGSLPAFVQAFNSLIIDRLIDALRELGPMQAKNAVGGIIETAKKAVLDVENRSGDINSATMTQLVQKYRRARTRTIGKKHATARNKRDRANLNQAMAAQET